MWTYLRAHQWVDWREQKYEDRGTGGYRRALDGLVDQVVARLKADEAAAERDDTPTPTAAADEEGLDELMERWEDGGTDALQGWTLAMEGLVAALVVQIQSVEIGRRGSTAGFHAAAAAVAPEVEDLRAENDRMSGYVRDLGQIADRIADLGSVDPDLDLAWLHEASASLSVAQDDLILMRSQMQLLRRTSKALRAPVDELTRSFRIFDDLRQLTTSASRRVRGEQT